LSLGKERPGGCGSSYKVNVYRNPETGFLEKPLLERKSVGWEPIQWHRIESDMAGL